jgi:fatty acid desaturase
MERSLGYLVALTMGCTLAAAIFGFGAQVYAWKSAYQGDAGREQLILLTRLLVFLVLAVTLVLLGGWRGVLAALAMVVGATLVEWALFPLSYEWAAISDPAGYEREFGEAVRRPAYGQFATYDILGIGISAALAQGLRIMAHVNPRAPRGG